MRSIAAKLSCVLLAVCITASAAGVAAGADTSAEAFVTINGQTKGRAGRSTEDNGSASFKVKDNHVEMTNFSFDADPSLKVLAEIPEEGLVFARAVVHDGENTIQHVADGHYREVFTQETVAAQLNDIYQAVLSAPDEPMTDEYIMRDSGVFVGMADLTDGQLVLLAKDGSDEYAVIAVTTMEYGSQEIIDAAFDALAEYDGEGSGEEASADVPETLHASVQPETDSPDWIKALPAAQDKNTSQLFVIAGMGMDKTTATVSMHERDENGNWKQILSTPGFIGKLGMCPDEEHAEGCAQTPIGTYHFNRAFGIAEDPGCALPYVKVTDDTYWSGDERDGMQYNEMVDIRDYPGLDLTNSEHITDYEYEYQYCLNISFNEEGTPGRGSAIFLHCIGLRKPYTGGCVAIPENIMRLVMQRVREDCVVVIDTFENMGGSF